MFFSSFCQIVFYCIFIKKEPLKGALFFRKFRKKLKNMKMIICSSYFILHFFYEIVKVTVAVFVESKTDVIVIVAVPVASSPTFTSPLASTVTLSLLLA